VTPAWQQQTGGGGDGGGREQKQHLEGGSSLSVDGGGGGGGSPTHSLASRVESVRSVLSGVVAVGADVVQHTGGMVVDGVMTTARVLHIDRIPGLKRLFRGYVHKGFFEAYSSMRPRLLQAIYKALCENPNSLAVRVMMMDDDG